MKSRSSLNVCGSGISGKSEPCPQDTSSPRDCCFNQICPSEIHCRSFSAMSLSGRGKERGQYRAHPWHSVHPIVICKASKPERLKEGLLWILQVAFVGTFVWQEDPFTKISALLSMWVPSGPPISLCF